jgi:hypothetical protein
METITVRHRDRHKRWWSGMSYDQIENLHVSSQYKEYRDYYTITIANYLPCAVKVEIPEAIGFKQEDSPLETNNCVILPAYQGEYSPVSLLLHGTVHIEFHVPCNRKLWKRFQDCRVQVEFLPANTPTIEQDAFNSTGWTILDLG